MVGRVFPSHGGGDHEVVGRVESPHPGTRPVGNPPRRLTPPPLPWRGIRSDTSAANSPPTEGGTAKRWGGFSPPAEGGTTKWWGGSNLPSGNPSRREPSPSADAATPPMEGNTLRHIRRKFPSRGGGDHEVVGRVFPSRGGGDHEVVGRVPRIDSFPDSKSFHYAVCGRYNQKIHPNLLGGGSPKRNQGDLP